MNTFTLKILSADRMFYEGLCESIVIPTTTGAYGIMAHHCQMIAAIEPGMMHFTIGEGERRSAAITGGMLKVENNTVLVLADAVEYPEEIDENRARREADAAREALLQKQSNREFELSAGQLARALNRLRVKGKTEI